MTGPISLDELEALREIAREPVVLRGGVLPAGGPSPRCVARLLSRQLVKYISDADEHRLVITIQGRRMLGE